MRELELQGLAVELSEVYAIEKVSDKKTRIYIGTTQFTLPIPYTDIKNLVEFSKKTLGVNYSTG